MRTSKVFVLGAIVGAAVMWLWGREMEAYVEEQAGKMRGRGAHALRRADELLHETKEHVRKTLHTARKA